MGVEMADVMRDSGRFLLPSGAMSAVLGTI
jgi:hypothetical protein